MDLEIWRRRKRCEDGRESERTTGVVVVVGSRWRKSGAAVVSVGGEVNNGPWLALEHSRNLELTQAPMNSHWPRKRGRAGRVEGSKRVEWINFMELMAEPPPLQL